MAGIQFTTPSVPFADTALNGGLNSTSGPLNVQNNEASDIQNIDFNKFGSIIKRNGYAALNTTVPSLGSGSITAYAVGATATETRCTDATHGLSSDDVVQITGTTSYNGTFVVTVIDANNFDIDVTFVADDATGTWNQTDQGDGLHWFEYTTSGATTRHAVAVMGGKLWKMDDLDGTWDDITGALTITRDNHVSFVNFNNMVYMVNGEDTPFKWNGTGNGSTNTLPTNITKPKYVALFENYLFYLNVTLSGALASSRIYWSDLADGTAFTDTSFIDIAKNDGQQITGGKVLSDRLVIYKERSIYNLFFTGDSTIPFIVTKSNSSVGCIAPFSIQEVNNGHVFLSTDGLYYYDGNNSFKVSDKITTTLDGYNTTQFGQARSLVQKNKNRYWLTLPSSGQTKNDKVIVWDFFNNAFSIYDGFDPSSMATFYVSGIEERPYFFDYKGFAYQADTGSDDYPLNVQTAINAYYWTNWKSYQDVINKKALPHATIYFQNSNSILEFAYSYDFESGEEFSQTFSLATSTDVYDTGVYGTATYAGSGGAVKRRDLTGRGRVVRVKFANSTLTETFQIDGFGSLPHLETTE